MLPPAIVAVTTLTEPDHADPGFAAEEFLSARLEMDVDAFPQFQSAYEELRRRLLEQPEITGVTFASRLPGMAHPEPGIDVDSDGTVPGPRELVTASAVGVDYFDTFGAQILAGRGFTPADLASAAPVVVVNEYFVNEILQGRNAIGRRIRYSTRYGERSSTGRPPGGTRSFMREQGGWYEIVGVVKNLGMDTTRDAFTSGKGPGIYHPLTPDAMGAGGSYSCGWRFTCAATPQRSHRS